MSGPEQTQQPEDQLLAEAASWFARMRGPDAEASRDAFEAWLRRGALHRAAYNRASEIFAMGKLLGGPDKAETGGPGKAAARPRRKIVVLATLLVALVGTAWLTLGRPTAPGGPADQVAIQSEIPSAIGQRLYTSPGETREARLEDGSVVRLSGATSLDVRFDGAVRGLVLERGTARFAVAHERRPLVVFAGGGRIIAVGTLFDVSVDATRRVTVRLLQGSVDVLPPRANRDAPPPLPRRLRAGEAMVFTASPGAMSQGAAAAMDEPPATARIPGVAPEESAAARDYDNVTLSALVAAANRDAVRPIRLATRAVETLRVSGRFRIDDTRVLAEHLASIFNLSVDRDRPGELVLRPH